MTYRFNKGNYSQSSKGIRERESHRDSEIQSALAGWRRYGHKPLRPKAKEFTPPIYNLPK